ncbi:MAG: hypothetical protein ACM3SV_12265 [Betaproteobacteria bacterium]
MSRQGAPTGKEGSSILESIHALLVELPGFVSDRVHLLALELQRARRALAQILGLLVLVGVLVGTAWLALWIGLAAAGIAVGLHWSVVWALVLAINLLGAWLALKRIQVLGKLLTLPATLRRMTVAPPDVSVKASEVLPPREMPDGHPKTP